MSRRPMGVGGRLVTAIVIVALGITGGTLLVDGHIEAFVWGFVVVVLLMSLATLVSDGRKR